MKGRGKVKGILIEGGDGHEYLLGFQTVGHAQAPTFSRRHADGTFETLSDPAASRMALAEVGLTGEHLIGPGMGKDFFLWGVFREALRSFPPVPTWPTWSP